ncbi:MAG: hypothetical protein JRI33_00635 [Deltaproteobacteria bacterium]|nr:hypothetical protein [Deltaproteobacteria bacterium]
MKYDFQAHYPLSSMGSITQAKAIDWLVGKDDRFPPGLRELSEVQDQASRISILTQAVGTAYKEQARIGTRGAAGGFRYWLETTSLSFLQGRYRLLQSLGLMPAIADFGILPPGSWAIRFDFTLRKPYLSRDDTEWYILDNPVRKDKVFGLPLVPSTGWKGALLASIRQEKGHTSWEQEQRDEQMTRLFGNIKGEERKEAFLAGRLRFYPTFFAQLSLEVINPHDRKAGSGSQPIYIECVPAGAKGTFSLLYLPFDMIGNKEEEINAQAGEDLQLVAQAIQAMMLIHGFSAKRTSGYGTAEDEIENSFARTQANEWKLTRLSKLPEEVADVAW